MTEKALAEIRSRLEAATSGPWHVTALDFRLEVDNAVAHRYMPGHGEVYAARDQLKRDAEFVAAARADIEALLNEVEQLRSRLAYVGGGFGEHD